MVGCHRSSRVNQYKAEKRTQDSVRLEEQVRSMTYYESQLEAMGPKADSLLALFSYERNEKKDKNLKKKIFFLHMLAYVEFLLYLCSGF